MEKSFVLKLICLILAISMIIPMVVACDNSKGEDVGEETSSTTDGDGTTTEGNGTTTDGGDNTTEGDGTPGEEDTSTTKEEDTSTTKEEDTSTTKEEDTSTTEEEDSTTVYEPAIDGLDIDSANLHGNMQNIFAGDTVYHETVMFIEKGQTKALLFPIDEIISVQRYDGRKISAGVYNYEEGKDYQVVNGMLYIPPTSSINEIIGSEAYCNGNGQLWEKFNGQNTAVYWGEGTTMTQWQLRVTYKHSKTWDGFKQESYINNYEGLIRKLMAGEDVTFIFYGDSITCGATSSWFSSVPTVDWYNPKYAFFQWSYSMLFTQAVADLFGYKIKFVDLSGLNSIIKKAPDDYTSATYVEGKGGTITYINPSVGGWTSANGLSNYDVYVKPYVNKYGCDLLGVAFGMNDASVDPATTASNILSIYDKTKALDSDFYGMVISTMIPNPEATNGWYGNQYKQEEKLEEIVDYLNDTGIKSGIARVTSVSQALVTRKSFRDYTGNNINHPNDFMHRVYAQTCLQAFIGYENIR